MGDGSKQNNNSNTTMQQTGGGASEDFSEAINVEHVHGKKQVIYNGVLFNFHDLQSNGNMSYRCKYYRRNKCSAKILYSKELGYFSLKGEHNHEEYVDDVATTVTTAASATIVKQHQQDRLQNSKTKRKTSSKDKQQKKNKRSSTNSASSSSSVVSSPTANVHLIGGELLSTTPAFLFEQLAFNSNFCKTISDEKFLQCLHIVPNFLLMYSSLFQLCILRAVSENDILIIHSSSSTSFSSSFSTPSLPPPTTELITVLVKKKYNNDIAPVAFALLAQRTVDSYKYFWQKLLELAPNLSQPTRNLPVFVDANKHMLAAMQMVVPKTEAYMSYLHIRNAVSKKLIKEGTLLTKQDVSNLFDVFKTIAYDKEIDFEETVAELWKQLTSIEQPFKEYLASKFLSAEGKYSPGRWAASRSVLKTDYDIINAKLERYEEILHALFGPQPAAPKSSSAAVNSSIHRVVQILRHLEHLYKFRSVDEKKKFSRLEDETETLLVNNEDLLQEMNRARKRSRENSDEEYEEDDASNNDEEQEGVDGDESDQDEEYSTKKKAVRTSPSAKRSRITSETSDN